jgi:glycosyltransferase involved in cell wall biosynthesis
MNILVLTQYYPFTEEAFAGIFVKQQVEIIGNHYNVTVLCFHVDYSWFSLIPKFSVKIEKTSQLEEINLTLARSFPIYNQANYFLSTWIYTRRHLLKTKKFDLVHAHVAYPAGVMAFLLKKLLHIPYILTEHTRIQSQNRSIFHKTLIKTAYKQADKIVVVSSFLEKEIKKELKLNPIVIPNVVDTNKFSIAHSQSGIFEIGFIGNFNNNNKGLDILLTACKRIRFPFRLHIVGNGSLIDQYKKMTRDLGINDYCIFYGKMKSHDLPKFYASLNLFILASRYETFGIVLIEAMAAGLPVISTNCGGPADIVTAQTGILVDIDNVEQMAAAIHKIKDNYGEYNSSVIRNYVEQKFGMDAFTNKIIALYHHYERL